MSLTFNLSWSWVPPSAVEQVRSVMDVIDLPDLTGSWREVDVLALDDALLMGEFDAESISDTRTTVSDGLYLADTAFVVTYVPVDKFVSDALVLNDSVFHSKERIRNVSENIFLPDNRAVGVGEIIVDEVSIGDGASLTLLNIPHTCSGSNRLLMVGVVTYIGGGGSIPAVTYNGVAMTALTSTLFGQSDNERLTVFYLVNPTVGSHTIAISVTPAQEIDAAAVSFVGVHQSNTLGIASVEAPDSVTSLALDVSSDSDDLVIDFVGWYLDTVGCGQNQILINENVDPLDSIAISTKRGDPITTMAWQLGGGMLNPKFPAHIGVSIHNLTISPQIYVRSGLDRITLPDTALTTISSAGHSLFVNTFEFIYISNDYTADKVGGGGGAGITDGTNFTVNVVNNVDSVTTIFDDCANADIYTLWNITWHGWVGGTDERSQWSEEYRLPTSADIPSTTVPLPHTNQLTKYICGANMSVTAGSVNAADVMVGLFYTPPAGPSGVYYETWAWWERFDPQMFISAPCAGSDIQHKWFSFAPGVGPYPAQHWYMSLAGAGGGATFCDQTGCLKDLVTDVRGECNDDGISMSELGAYNAGQNPNMAGAWVYREFRVKLNQTAGFIKCYASSLTRTPILEMNYAGPTNPAVWGTGQRTAMFGGFDRDRGSKNWRYWADVYYHRQSACNGAIVLTNNSVYTSATKFAHQKIVSRTGTSLTCKCRKGVHTAGLVHVHYRDDVFGNQYLGTLTMN